MKGSTCPAEETVTADRWLEAARAALWLAPSPEDRAAIGRRVEGLRHGPAA